MEKTDIIVYNLLLEKDSTIIYCNDDFKNYIKKNPINHKLSDLFSYDIYETIRKMMLESLFTNNEVKNIIVINNRFYNVNISPILDNNLNVKNLLLSYFDITKNKKIDDEIETLKIKLDESNSIKSVFLSNISHELRTPMNAIIGFSDILISEGKDDRFLKSIKSNAKLLDELLNNLLDYSRLESNEFDILYERFSINDLIDELFDIFNEINYKTNLDLVKLIFIKNDKDIKIVSDYLRLKQVLYNIISNSIKFTERGYIKLTFDIFNNSLTFKIEDTGIGIEKDKIKYVFDRFWQNDSSSTKKYKGTGLGLSISKSIIDILNGKIWLESNINKGTIFYVTLPLDNEKEHEIIDNKNKITFNGKTTLVVDELPINYSLLGIYLKSFNINLISANNAKDSIEIYKKQKDKIELIFIDLNLPDMDYLKLIKKLKSIGNCKIISKSPAKSKKNNLIDYHLQKPVNKEKLLLILNEIWQK